MYHFLADMLEVLPCATFYKRQVSASLPQPPPLALTWCFHLGADRPVKARLAVNLGSAHACLDWLFVVLYNVVI